MNPRLNGYLDSQIAALKDKGIFRMPRVLESAAGPRVRMDGRDIIQLSSNNYLGLTTHPKVVQAARQAVEMYGAGPGAVRTIAGTMSLHPQETPNHRPLCYELECHSRCQLRWEHDKCRLAAQMG